MPHCPVAVVERSSTEVCLIWKIERDGEQVVGGLMDWPSLDGDAATGTAAVEIRTEAARVMSSRKDIPLMYGVFGVHLFVVNCWNLKVVVGPDDIPVQRNYVFTFRLLAQQRRQAWLMCWKILRTLSVVVTVMRLTQRSFLPQRNSESSQSRDLGA